MRFPNLPAPLSCFSVAVLSLAVSACFDGKKVWIVVDLLTPGGQIASMAFDNPSVPDMTLKECESSIEAAIPTLMASIRNEPRLLGATFKSAKCVESVNDPIQPDK